MSQPLQSFIGDSNDKMEEIATSEHSQSALIKENIETSAPDKELPIAPIEIVSEPEDIIVNEPGTDSLVENAVASIVFKPPCAKTMENIGNEEAENIKRMKLRSLKAQISERVAFVKNLPNVPDHTVEAVELIKNIMDLVQLPDPKKGSDNQGLVDGEQWQELKRKIVNHDQTVRMVTISQNILQGSQLSSFENTGRKFGN